MKTITLFLFLVSLTAVADDKAEFMELARSRKYRGGPDESDLKVQVVLYQAPGKKKKNQKVDEPGEGF